MLSLQREEEAGSEAINLLYAGHPGRVVDVVLQVAVAVGDDVVQASEHQPRPVETRRQYKTSLMLLVVTVGGDGGLPGGEHDHAVSPGGVQQCGVEIIEISPPLLGDVFVKYTSRPIFLHHSLQSVKLAEFLWANKLFSNLLEQIH